MDSETAHEANLLLEPLPYIEAYKAGIDRTLIIEKLKLTPEERFIEFEKLVRLHHELRNAKRLST